MTQELTVIEKYTKEQIQLIKNTVCKGASDDELKLFLYVANKTQLDPLLRQIYSVSRFDNTIGMYVRTNQVGIDGLRIIVQRTGKYRGTTKAEWCGEDGQWRDVWLSKAPPMAARIGIHMDGFNEPVYGVALYEAFVQRFQNKTTKQYEPNNFWKKMPDVMLAKVAEAQALRKASPMDLSDLFITEEMPLEGEIPEPVKKVELKEEDKSKIIEVVKKSNELLEKVREAANEKSKGRNMLQKGQLLKELGVNKFDDLISKDDKYLEDCLVKIKNFNFKDAKNNTFRIE